MKSLPSIYKYNCDKSGLNSHGGILKMISRGCHDNSLEFLLYFHGGVPRQSLEAI